MYFQIYLFKTVESFQFIACFNKWLDCLIWEEYMQSCLSIWQKNEVFHKAVAVWRSLCMGESLRCLKMQLRRQLAVFWNRAIVYSSLIINSSLCNTLSYHTFLYWWMNSNRGRIPALVPESIPLVVWLDDKGPDCPHFPSLHHPDKLPTLHLEWSMWYKCDAISHRWSGKVA